MDNPRGVSSYHVLVRAFGDAYMRRENVRHATLLFRAESVNVRVTGAEEGGMGMAKAETSQELRQSLDWGNKVSFCDDKIVSVAEVVKTLVDNLHLGKVSTILRERYSKMKGLFGTASANDPEWKQTGCDIEDTQKHKDVLLGIPRGMFDTDNEIWCGGNGILGREDVGLDLPTWMELEGSKRTERIMIVASEPKRAVHTSGSLWLSSPWAFHSMEYRARMKNPLMLTIVESFMCERQAVVYLTDCRKIYDADKIAQNSYADEYKRCLEREIKLFGPTVLIGYGANVYRALKPELKVKSKCGFSQLVCDGPHKDEYGVIPTRFFAHPSGMNACHDCIWSKLQEKHAGISRKDALLKYYTEWE